MDGVYPMHGHDTKMLVSCKSRVATAVCAQVRLLPANELFVYSATEPLFRFSIRPSTLHTATASTTHYNLILCTVAAVCIFNVVQSTEKLLDSPAADTCLVLHDL